MTEFEFTLHELGPEVAVAQAFYPYEDAERIITAWPEVALAAPKSVTPQLVLWSVPPDPALPAELHGMPVVIAAGLYAGPAHEADAALPTALARHTTLRPRRHLALCRSAGVTRCALPSRRTLLHEIPFHA